MSNSGKVFIIIFIAIIGVVILTMIKEMRGASIGFFALFGVAIYLVSKSLFGKPKSNNETDESNEKDLTLKK